MHGIAVLSGGAMRVVDARTRSAEIADDCTGFLCLDWHDHGTGVFSHLRLADETPAGQFEFYFCSADCLRGYLNASVDKLEASIRVGERKALRRKQRKKR